MNIFLRELKANARSLLIWSVIVSLLNIEAITEFSAYYDKPDMLAILDAMPPAMLDAFNIRAFNLTTLSGFLGVLFMYISLLLGIAAAIWGSDIISKEERDKTVEFSLTLPVTRSRVITAKALAALANCLLLAGVTWGVFLLLAQKYEPDSAFYDFTFLLVRAALMLQLIFLSMGIFLGSALSHYKRAGSMAVGVLLITYFFAVISDLHEKLGFLKWASPFKYYDAGDLYRNGALDEQYLLLSALIIVVAMVGAYVTYNRRDMQI